MKLLVFSLSIILILLRIASQTVQATPPKQTVLLINQVRGTECCDVGILEALKMQRTAMRENKLQGTFALRFDALDNSEIIAEMKSAKEEGNELAIFLEITPNLVKEAGVTYKGPLDRWYKAQYAYLLGYTKPEREKIIDTVFAQFKRVFSHYPTSTVAWMIDAQSLSYMHEKYGVIVHEITREQYSTDSYTLYGGIPNGAYFPSKNWTLLPGLAKENTLQVLVVRQTTTDPLYTYGDWTSTTTSQPNDYLEGQRDFSYFQKLLDSGLSSKPYGIAVIGLENSMTIDPYQYEYIRQLQHIADRSKSESIPVLPLSSYAKSFTNANTRMFLSSRTEEQKSAYWIATSRYRVRLIKNESDISITDLRMYDDLFEDPYTVTPLSVSDATWIVPFFLDGSRSFSPLVENRLFTKLLVDEKPKTNLIVSNDFNSTPAKITLPTIDTGSQLQSSYSNARVTISYTSSGKPISLSFYPEHFEIQPVVSVPPESLTQHLKNELDLVIETKGNVTQITPIIKPEANSGLIATIAATLTPEFSMGEVHRESSIANLTNRFAIVGKNPVRIVLRLRDIKNHPTLARDEITITSDRGDFEHVNVHYPQISDGEYFLDISHSVSGKFIPIVSIDGKEWSMPAIHFVRDCRTQATYCLQYPNELAKYVYTKISDRLRRK